MSGELTLTEFLLARVAEDEAVAREAGDARRWRAVEEGDDAPFFTVLAGIGPRSNVADAVGKAEAAHIARHDPARVLAECDAKRRIVEDALFDVRTARRRPGWTVPDEQLDEKGRAYRLGAENQKAKQLPDVLDRTDRLLRLLALPYADHPAFREEWQP